MENCSTLSSILIWDFFGKSAAPTAEHFKVHLEEFLVKNSIAAEKIELVSEETLHMGVRCCIADPAVAQLVAKTLRASRRSMLSEPSENLSAP